MSRPIALFLTLCLSVPGHLIPSVWAGHQVIPINAAQRAALRIVTTPITAHAGAISVGLPATVAIPPAQERVVAAPVAGLVSEVRVAAGEPIRAGQVLGTLRSEQLIAGQREAAQAAVQLRLAEETARRDAALFKEGIIPESRLLAARAASEQARAAQAERRAWLRLMGLSKADIRAVEAGERLIDSVALTAPFAGVLLEQMTVTGARVDAATALFHVARLDPLWLDIQTPAEVASLVHKGQKVSVPGTRASGKVVLVGQNVTAAQTVLVRAQVGDPDRQLRLNQTVSVRIEDVAGSRHWRVPVQAVVQHQGQSHVFIERAGGFEPHPVKVLSRTAQSIAVDGVFTGEEKIAVEGVAALKAAWQGEK